jgi:hypothetical protein
MPVEVNRLIASHSAHAECSLGLQDLFVNDAGGNIF